MIYKDREHAGKALSRLLVKKSHGNDLIVVGIPSGGVIVALQVAKALDAAFNVICVEKIRMPESPEVALGAVAEGNFFYENFLIVKDLKLHPEEFQYFSQKAVGHLNLKCKKFRTKLDKLSFKAKTVILVDDGIATSATISAAIYAIRGEKPEKIIVAVPVAAPEVVEQLKREFPEVEFLCISKPIHFMAVGQFYKEFPQLQLDEVLNLISKIKK